MGANREELTILAIGLDVLSEIFNILLMCCHHCHPLGLVVTRNVIYCRYNALLLIVLKRISAASNNRSTINTKAPSNWPTYCNTPSELCNNLA